METAERPPSPNSRRRRPPLLEHARRERMRHSRRQHAKARRASNARTHACSRVIQRGNNIQTTGVVVSWK